MHERDTDLYQSVTPLAPVSCDQTANFTHEMGNKEERVMRIGMIGAGWQGGRPPHLTLYADGVPKLANPLVSFLADSYTLLEKRG